MKVAQKMPLAAAYCALGALVTGCLAFSPAMAADARGEQANPLVVGVDYVVPPHLPGATPRTPEGLDEALIETFNDHARPGAQASMLASADPAKAVADSKVDFSLVALDDIKPADADTVVVSTGYVAGPMAIMRSDTDIKRWDQLKGRTVCVSEGGLYVGKIAAQYGAIEMVYKAPADSLIALRIGECDAAVHDNNMLEELIKFPEWKKFSARLPVRPGTTLAWVFRAADKHHIAHAKDLARQWKADGHFLKLNKKMVQNIAFEVYLDQEVVDCH